MIKRIFNWIKSNKLAFLLLIALAYLLATRNGGIMPYYSKSMYNSAMGGVSINSMRSAPMLEMASDSYAPSMPTEAAPRPGITERKMVTNSNFSLYVKDVTGTLNNIKAKINELKGYIVDINVNRPELGETATIEFRVPVEKVDDVTNFLRSQAIKVVSENINGYDVTDQFTDIQEYLAILEKNKTTMENILTSAKTVDEILRVQSQIFSLQAQIDSYKGQLKYLEGTSSTSLITAYISTDETGLPYSEPLSWRPEVIFKHAVRSLIGTLQGVGTALIWLGVYSVLIVPALTIVLIVLLLRRRAQQKSQQ